MKDYIRKRRLTKKRMIRMKECICSSCRNLKGNFEQNEDEILYECRYGYPSESCEECNIDECELECSEYIPDDGSEDMVVVRCASCGKELEKACEDNEAGEVYCFECYLNKSN